MGNILGAKIASDPGCRKLCSLVLRFLGFGQIETGTLATVRQPFAMPLCQIFLRITFIVFSVEALVMLLLAPLEPYLRANGFGSDWPLAMIDSSLLVLIAGPLIYVFAVRPFVIAQRHAEHLLLDAVENISEGFVIFDSQDRLVLCNSRLREMYPGIADVLVPGVTFEEILRTGLARGQYPETAGREEAFIAARVEQRRSPKRSSEQLLATGRWVKVLETRTPTGGVVGIRTDITNLKIREQRFRQIVDSLQEGFVLYDPNDRIVLWNEAWLRLHKDIEDLICAGVTFDTLIKARVSREAIPEAIGREEAFIADRIEKHRNPGEAFVRETKDGQWVVVREVRTPEGGVFALNIDITELKKVEKAAQEARLRAEEAASAKSAFLANMSHELRTPLNAVIGFADMLKRRDEIGLSPDNVPEYLDAIYTSGQHLLELINDLLDLSKIEAGKMELNEEPIDLTKLISELRNQIEKQANNAGLHFSTPQMVDLPIVVGDKLRLRQVLLNLLSNAIKYTSEGGYITLSVADCDDGGLAISIRDTGIGMSEVALQSLGEAFRQFGGFTKRSPSGTGLGVSIAMALAALHDARLAYTSEPGVGTTVTLLLPAYRVEQRRRDGRVAG